jgi:hypothetical protein
LHRAFAHRWNHVGRGKGRKPTESRRKGKHPSIFEIKSPPCCLF